MSEIYKIEDYLNLVYEDLKPYINGTEMLCPLKNLNYCSEAMPDYTNLRIVQLYLLKYAYAYNYEYVEIFRKVLPWLKNQQNITVASIGCGTRIDYWSLLQAMGFENMNCPINYTGLDKVEWAYSFGQARPEDTMTTYLHTSAVDKFLKVPKFISDVYLFPKSICEFSLQDIRTIGSCFQTKPIEKDRFFLCVSIRNSSESKKEDLEKIDILTKSIEQNGFQAYKMYPEYYVYDTDSKISDCQLGYDYPEEIKHELTSLHKNCIMYNYNGRNCSSDCEEKLSRYPILRTRQICYQIIRFERG